MTGADIIRHQSLVRRVPVPDHIYLMRRGWRGRRGRGGDSASVAEAAGFLGSRAARGAVSDPGCQGARGTDGELYGAARGYSGIGRAGADDRIITTFAAQAEGIDSKEIVRRLMEETEAEQEVGSDLGWGRTSAEREGLVDAAALAPPLCKEGEAEAGSGRDWLETPTTPPGPPFARGGREAWACGRLGGNRHPGAPLQWGGSTERGAGGAGWAHSSTPPGPPFARGGRDARG